MKILITGATGLVGKALSRELFLRGHDLVITTRSIDRTKFNFPYPASMIEWDGISEFPTDTNSLNLIQNVEAVFHLMGEPIADHRWSQEIKQRLVQSRVTSTKKLVSMIKLHLPSLETFVQASAIGIYGNRGDEELSEESPNGTGFLADLCAHWENEARESGMKARFVALRTGLVLARGEGFLGRLEAIYKNGLGGPLGSGKHWMSWIHIKDLVSLFLAALSSSKMKGPINAVSPFPVQNRDFSKIYSRLFGFSLQLPVPIVALKLAFGELASILVESQRVLPLKAQQQGFNFNFPDLDTALNNLYLLDSSEAKDECFVATQFIPKPIDEVFDFFRNEKNLDTITPDSLRFKVLNASDPSIQLNTTIDYSLKINGLPVKWRSKISVWKPPQHFVDEQLKGPYSKWYHNHRFTAVNGGTLVDDEVFYRLPLGMAGRLGGLSWVKSDLEHIFNFRRKKLAEIFTTNH